MKVKFGFKKIYSESDTITVNADDEQIMLFKKSDFNNDWQNLVNNGVIYEIAPYKVSRLETLTCKGGEVKNPTYSEETREKWFEYARQFIDVSNDLDTNTNKKFKDINPEKTVIICNSGTDATRIASISTYLGKYAKENNYNLKIDLSNFIAPDYNKTPYNYGLLGKTSSSYFKDISKYIISLPKNFSNLINKRGNLDKVFDNCKNLIVDCKDFIDITPKSIRYAFKECGGILNLDKLNLDNIEANGLYSAFVNVELQNVPENIINAAIKSNSTNIFNNCTIDNMSLCKSSFLYADSNSIKHINIFIHNRSIDSLTTADSKIDIDKIDYLKVDDPSATLPKFNKQVYINEITVVDMNGYQGKLFSNYPKKVGAISYLASLPESTGYDYWVDYIKSDNDALKQITVREINYEEHINSPTVKLSGHIFKIPFVDAIKPVTSYPYEFELVEILSVTLSGTSNYNNISSTKNKAQIYDNNIAVTISEFNNISDNSVSKCDLSLYIKYKAKISGYDFIGATYVTIHATFDFMLDKDVDMIIELDESEETETETETESIEV